MAEEAVSAGSTGLLTHGATPADVYRAAAQGDPHARVIVDRAGRWLAVALQQLIMMYDVESVVLGGGVSRAGEVFLEPVLAALEEMRTQSALAHEMIKPGMITLLDPTYDAGAWGGVALAQDALKSKEEGKHQ
jgi:glucokinase